VNSSNEGHFVWKVFDCGKKTAKHNAPVIFLPPMEATCDVFFKQMNFLSKRGYRVLSLEYPSYTSADQFCIGFQNVLDVLQIFKVDVFACGLGGFFLSHFLQTFRYNRLVRSAVFCNAFTNTANLSFTHYTINLMPKFHLKKLMLRNLNPRHNNSNYCNSNTRRQWGVWKRKKRHVQEFSEFDICRIEIRRQISVFISAFTY